jgi:hypothetical protein
MSEVSIEPLLIPAANFGGENPLTPLRSYETASMVGATAGAVQYPDRGNEASILPYRLQDQYDRRRRLRAFKTAVLENKHLRATFLLNLGGRIRSIIDKRTGRELLFVNPVFQPANFAVRDAWYTGGVEWNIGIIGHSPFACAPMFAARIRMDDGREALRLWEWDRIRRVPFQIDCWLDHARPFLFVRVRVVNPHDYTIPMYWWSNIGVPEREDVRVLSPAHEAYRHDYDGSLVEHCVPIYQGVDVTYTTNRHSAADLYFRIPTGHRPWIAALDREGRGLVHSSTALLRGRKMFNLGVHAGGKRWQEFLAEPGHRYIEIQGGLAQTQGEYVAMPAKTEWSWLEGYGLLEAEAAKVHSRNWAEAHEATERELEKRLPGKWMEEALTRSASAIADLAPAEMLHEGTGWGALEARRRARADEGPIASAAMPFPESSLSEDQMPWIQLLERGELAVRAVSSGPAHPMVQPEWHALLEHSARQNRGEHWLTWYHLGVMRYRHNDLDGAKQAWNQSLAAEENPWAYRDLAVVARDAGDKSAAADLWLKAARLAPDIVGLAIECARMLYDAARFDDLVHFSESLSPLVRNNGRLRLLRAMAALALGDLATVEQYFEGDVDIANIREKETSLSDLWFGWHEQRLARERNVPIDEHLKRLVRREFPPPMQFDFRLNVEVD